MLDYSVTLNNNSIGYTDKFAGGCLNDPVGHNYQLLYKNFINDQLNSILEIGTGHGGFAKFLLDNKINIKSVVGVDIQTEPHLQYLNDYTNYNHLYTDFYHGNAFSFEFINWIIEKNYLFDFIIEDGNHDPQCQSFMLAHVDKLLIKNGVYVCEDVGSYGIAKQLIHFVPKNYKKYSYVWDASDSTGRHDDICVVVDTRS